MKNRQTEQIEDSNTAYDISRTLSELGIGTEIGDSESSDNGDGGIDYDDDGDDDDAGEENDNDDDVPQFINCIPTVLENFREFGHLKTYKKWCDLIIRLSVVTNTSPSSGIIFAWALVLYPTSPL